MHNIMARKAYGNITSCCKLVSGWKGDQIEYLATASRFELIIQTQHRSAGYNLSEFSLHGQKAVQFYERRVALCTHTYKHTRTEQISELIFHKRKIRQRVHACESFTQSMVITPSGGGLKGSLGIMPNPATSAF